MPIKIFSREAAKARKEGFEIQFPFVSSRLRVKQSFSELFISLSIRTLVSRLNEPAG
jgi:hypothetical protein